MLGCLHLQCSVCKGTSGNMQFAYSVQEHIVDGVSAGILPVPEVNNL